MLLVRSWTWFARFLIFCVLLSLVSAARMIMPEIDSKIVIVVRCEEQSAHDEHAVEISMSSGEQVATLKKQLENEIGVGVRLVADDARTEIRSSDPISAYANDEEWIVKFVRQVVIFFNGKMMGVVEVHKDDTFQTLWGTCLQAAKKMNMKDPNKPPQAHPSSESMPTGHSNHALYSASSSLPTTFITYNASQVYDLRDGLFSLVDSRGTKSILRSVDFAFVTRLSPVLLFENTEVPDASRILEGIKFEGSSTNDIVVEFQNSTLAETVKVEDVRRNLEVQLGIRTLLETPTSKPMEDYRVFGSYFTDGMAMSIHVQRYVVATFNGKYARRIDVHPGATFKSVWQQYSALLFTKSIPKWDVEALPSGNRNQRLYSSSSSLPKALFAWSDAQVYRLRDSIFATRDKTGARRVLYTVDYRKK